MGIARGPGGGTRGVRRRVFGRVFVHDGHVLHTAVGCGDEDAGEVSVAGTGGGGEGAEFDAGSGG